jgi:hypothetical protein
LKEIGLSKAGSSSVLQYLRFCELGAVSPDYPYLSIGSSDSAQWADLMHSKRTGEVIRAGIEGVRALSAERQQRAFAWLLGYAAHVAADVTIHPVVELKVGRYEENKKDHRVCEMHQDAYIFSRLNLGEVGVSEHLESGILRCTDGGQPGVVDATVKALWEGMLKKVHSDTAKDNAPAVDRWHRDFDFWVNKLGEEGYKLFPIARHVAVNCGLTYPAARDVDVKEYIEDLTVPGNGTRHYDQIFNFALTNIGKAWVAIDKAVYGNDPESMGFFGNWNLDTGRDENNQLVFWS